jgi:glycine oxidase
MAETWSSSWSTQPRHASYDFVVVGGGIVGMSVAWELGRRCQGARTLLVTERSSVLSASAAAGVMLSGYAETTVLTHATAAGTAKAKLRLDGARLWPEWLATVNEVGGSQVDLEDHTVVILNPVGGTLDEFNFAAILAELNAAGEPYETIAPLDLPLRPAPHGRPLRAIGIPSERWVDGPAVLRTVATALSRLPSLELVQAASVSIAAQAPSGGCSLRIGDKRVEAGETVLASGYRTSMLLGFDNELAASIPRMLGGCGTAFRCEMPALRPMPTVAVRTPNRAFACGLHALSWGNSGVCYVGATNNVQANVDGKPLVTDIGFLVDCAVAQIDRRLARATLGEIRLGARPVTEDSFPLLGRTTRRGLWLATGTFRDGFLCAPVLARRLVDAILAQRLTLAGLEAFVPCRSPISPCSVEAAIRAAVDNYLAIAFERGARLPAVGGWVEDFAGAIEARVRAVYEASTASHTIPPDFLWDVEYGDLGPVFGIPRPPGEVVNT